LKVKYVYFLIAALAIVAVVYPVAYSYVANTTNNQNPYLCTPLIPCAQPPKATTVCHSVCTIEMIDTAYSPASINVTVGSTLIFVNKDGISHTVTGFNTTFANSAFIEPGHEFTLNITSNMALGTYYYHCTVHPPMIGSITVVP
jgi:plastocyanin